MALDKSMTSRSARLELLSNVVEIPSSIFALAFRIYQFRRPLSLEDTVFKRTSLQDQAHQIGTAVKRSPVLA